MWQLKAVGVAGSEKPFGPRRLEIKKKNIVVSETEMNVDLMAQHICKLTFSNLLTKHAKF